MAIYQNGKEVTPKLNGKNLSRVMYNGKKIWPTESDIVESKDANYADICVANKNDGDKLIIIKSDKWTAEKYPIDICVPIGVVVVPTSHGHYADGKCAIMSLTEMNCDTPQTGANSPQYMYWGDRSVDISSLPNLNQVPYVGTNGNVGSDVIGQTGYACLPSDHSNFNKVANPYDNKTKYYYNNYSYNYIPSPYNNDGTFNPNYSLTTSPSSTANCLADFDGYNNTKKILEVRGSKDYSTWKPTYNNEDDYPAASCCDMYSTYGTNQGEWYLPSAGELGYAVVRQQAINDTISKLISAGVTNASIVSLYYYWSSSEYSSDGARNVGFSNGRVHFDYKYGYGYYVRACRLV